jgi:hypothetical protein
MKLFNLNLLLFLLLHTPYFSNAQIKMGNHPLEIDPHAIFEVESNNQGVLLPRMSSAERDNAFKKDIPNGLLIFNLTETQFEFFDATQKQWRPVQTPLPRLSIENNQLHFTNDNSVDLSPWLDNTDRQQLHLEGTLLSLENGGSVNLSKLLTKTQPQKLNLEGTILTLENGGSVNLNALFTQNNDHQQLSLSGSQISLERGGSLDLAPLLMSSGLQKINHFKLVSNTLELSLSSDEESPHKVSLEQINTDNQQLSITSSTLQLQNGGQVDLSEFYDNTDSQNFILSIPNSKTLKLEISNGNFLTLTNSGSLSFSKLDSNTAFIHITQSPFSTNQSITSNIGNDWESNDFVFGSPQLDNDPTNTEDNKRMFFDKSKAAFRAGTALSDQWDEDNIGTYSVAMGRNTIASGFHATAFGLSTQSKAWYSTAMGQSTIAHSRSETVLGSYNTTYTPAGGTRDWNSSDRLFVIGNGRSTSSRKDALIIFKDGTAIANGDWTGTGFHILSDRRLKANIKPLKQKAKKLFMLQSKQFNYIDSPKDTQFGFLAQELEKVYPELVYGVSENDTIGSINYLGLIPLLVEVVQKQQKEIDQLKKEIKKM